MVDEERNPGCAHVRPTIRFLSLEQREGIVAGALRILERVGVKLTEPEARDLLADAGARLAGERVTIPPDLVEAAIASAPSRIAIHTQNGDLVTCLGRANAFFGAHTDAPDVEDPCTGERRPCNESDVARHAALIDELPNIGFATASGMVADRSPHVADRVALAQCLSRSCKPVLAMPVTLDALKDSHAMAALAVGGPEALRKRPSLIVYAEPVSPLSHPDESVRKLVFCAEHAIPLVYTPYAAMGATAPMSPAAIVAQLCAESLSGLVIHQLKRPGAPFIFGGMASVMDMRTTIFSYGAPEFQRGNTWMAEIAHHLDLPNFGTAGTSDAQVFDGQAVLEATSSCLLAFLSGADLIHDVGLLGSATVVVPAMIVATNEIIGMLQHLVADVEVSDEALALEVMEEIGPGGEFVTHSHTLEHFRDVWYPELLYRAGAESWVASDRQTFRQRVEAATAGLIQELKPPALDEGIYSEIQAILAQAEEDSP